MSLVFSLKESLRGLRAARLAALITATTIAFLLILTSVFVVLSYNLNRLADVLHAQVQIQAFVSETTSELELGELSAKILDMKEVEAVDYVSKEQAAADFQREFGDEIFDILEENPLPASFLVRLLPEYRSESDIEQVADILRNYPQIVDVSYHGRALGLLNHYGAVSKWLNMAIILFVVVASLLIVSNTIRLIIISRRDVIYTMQLVGATASFIRRPYYFEGLFQGFGGALLALIFLYAVFLFVHMNWPTIIYLPPFFPAIVLLAGAALGCLGATIAIKKFL